MYATVTTAELSHLAGAGICGSKMTSKTSRLILVNSQHVESLRLLLENVAS